MAEITMQATQDADEVAIHFFGLPEDYSYYYDLYRTDESGQVVLEVEHGNDDDVYLSKAGLPSTLYFYADVFNADSQLVAEPETSINAGTSEHYTVTDGQFFVLIADKVYHNGVPHYGDGGSVDVQSGGIASAAGAVTFAENTTRERVSSVSGFGGALCNRGSVMLADAGFYANSAENAGGAIANFQTLDLVGNIFFSTNKAPVGGAVYNQGVIRLMNSITLVTASDTWVNEGNETNFGITNWDLRSAPPGNKVCINNYQYFSNVGDRARETITVNHYQALGNYTIATGDLSSITGKDTFFLTLDSADYSTALVAGGAAVTYKDRMYMLDVYGTSLIVSVYESQRFVATIQDPVTLQAGKIYSNTLPYYGNGGAGEVQIDGILNAAGEVAFVADAVLKKGTSDSGNGGALINQGTAQLQKSTFMYNSADIGGAVYNVGNFTITGAASFVSNAARNTGGAIENYSWVTCQSDATFVQNYAETVGGALNNYGQMVFSGATQFYNNQSKQQGGAICNHNIINFNGSVFFSENNSVQGGAIYNESLIRIAGSVTLVTSWDTWVNQGSETNYAITNWDLTNAPASNAVCINNFQYFSNVGDKVSQTITVNTDQALGNYTIATGDLSDLTGKNTFLLTVDGSSYSDALVAGGSAIIYQGRQYQLGVYSTSLIMTVSAAPSLAMAMAPQSDAWGITGSDGDLDFAGASSVDDALNIDTADLTDDAGCIADLTGASSVNLGDSAAPWMSTAEGDDNFTLTSDEAQKTLAVSKLA